MKMKDVQNTESEMCFTSLIDIVFLLLIFFMCATHFKQTEQRLDAFLPADGQDRILPPPPILERLSIFVKDDAVARQSKNPYVSALRQATYYPLSREAKPIADLNGLRGILERVHDAQPGTGILIVPFDEFQAKDQLVPFFNVVAVLDTCKAVGIDDVAFQAPGSTAE